MSWVVSDEKKAKRAGAQENDRVLYVLTVEDLVTIYEDERGEESWDKLDEETRAGLVRMATKYIEDLMDGSGYSWANALEDAIQDVEEDK